MEASSRNFLNTQLLPVRKSPVAGPASAFLISVAGLLRLTQDAITTNKPTSQYNPRTVSRCASSHWKSVRSKHSTTLQEVTGHGGSSHQCIKRNKLYGSSQRSVPYHVSIYRLRIATKYEARYIMNSKNNLVQKGTYNPATNLLYRPRNDITPATASHRIML